MLVEIFPDVFRWTALDVVNKRHLNGYAVRIKAGLVLIDPPSVPENALPELEALGRPRAVVLTGRAQERRAKQFQDWYGAKILAPELDQKLMRVRVDHYYASGETVPGGFKAIGVPNQRTPGESVLFHAKFGVLLAGYLVGEPAGFIQLEDRSVYASYSKALEAQLPLLPLEFDRILPGRGTPVLKSARITFAKYLASVEPDGAKGHL